MWYTLIQIAPYYYVEEKTTHLYFLFLFGICPIQCKAGFFLFKLLALRAIMAGSGGRGVLTVAGTQKHVGVGAGTTFGDEARVSVWQSLGCLFSEGIIN